MKYFQTFQVFPAIPEPLSFLEKLSRNIWWSWQHDAIELFRRIDPKLWSESERNPIRFLSMVPQTRFEELAGDNSFLGHLTRMRRRFEGMPCTPSENPGIPAYDIKGKIAYFSMEFGIHESLPLYAGGLGILAGDHLKAASDMGLPMIGIGLLYRQGYFYQFLNQEGMQQESYPESDIFQLPIEREKDASGTEIFVTVTGPDGEMKAAVWKTMVGCIPLYLLDTNLPENSQQIRDVTAMLYAGDQKTRLAQELLLGIGGIRVLSALGIEAGVVHLNEGHCAFAGIERLAQTMSRHSVDLKTALEIVPRSTVFTTHTPVAAGYDEFPPELIRMCLSPYQQILGISVEDIINLGQHGKYDPKEPLSMFVLGVRLSQYCNGVSKLHGEVARRMWNHVWPKRSGDEVPITHVTNGVHVPTWISYEFARLFERYLGPEWSSNPFNPEIIHRIEEIYAEELWRAHEMNRARLIRTCRELMRKQYDRRNAPKSVMEHIESVLDPDVLTIGFARRFASYKRSYLILKDPERLGALITSKKHPIQIIFSGKAHPKDREGKDLIQGMIEFARKESIRHRVVFLENYDPHIARHLVQGADVWLNTPRRPMEACGTSGMKAALNGVLNVSILDGWWAEGYSEETGWRIGNGEEYFDHDYQDAVESQAIYNILEDDVIPLFYDRKNGGGLPIKWIKKMKASMEMAIQRFSSHKMLAEYTRRFYQPASNRLMELTQKNALEAKDLSKQRVRLLSHWDQIKVKNPDMKMKNRFHVGDTVEVTTEVFLGELKPDEVVVSLYYGPLKSIEQLETSRVVKMTVEEDLERGAYLYSCRLLCDFSGRYGFTTQVSPQGDDWVKFTPNLLTWAG